MRYPFAGPTGKEVDMYYLPYNGMFRDDVAVTNARLCSDARYRNPEPEEAWPCAAWHLPETIEEVQPDIIVPMGAVACSMFRTAHGSIQIDMEHGIPTIGALAIPGSNYRWVGRILPMYHPSAGIHDSNTRYHLQRDFPMLREMVRHDVSEHPVQPAPIKEYRLLEGLGELQAVLADVDSMYFATDTETDCQGFDLDPLGDPPFCLSFSGRIGTGYVVMAESAKLLGWLADWLKRKRPTVLMWHAQFDVPVLERLGVSIPGPKGLWPLVHDLMLDAYHTGWAEQGLKAFSYRHLGLRMSEYEDVVKPHALNPQMAYIMKVAGTPAKQIPQPYLGPRQWKLPRRAQTALDTAMVKGVLPQDYIKQNWLKDHYESFATMEEHFGRFPYCSIKHAPLDQTVYYSGQDADVTLRARVPLRRELVRIRQTIGV